MYSPKAEKFATFRNSLLQLYQIEKISSNTFVLNRLNIPQNYLLLQFFLENEHPNSVRQKTRSKFLFPIFKHVFPFFVSIH